MESEPSRLLGLPTELLVDIFISTRSISSFIHLAQTCKTLHNLFRQNADFMVGSLLESLVGSLSQVHELADLLEPLQSRETKHSYANSSISLKHDLEVIIARKCVLACDHFNSRLNGQRSRWPRRCLTDSERERFMRAYLRAWIFGINYASNAPQATVNNLLRGMSLKEIKELSKIANFLGTTREQFLRRLESSDGRPLVLHMQSMRRHATGIETGFDLKLRSLGLRKRLPICTTSGLRHWFGFLDEDQGPWLYDYPPDDVALRIRTGELSWSQYAEQLESEYGDPIRNILDARMFNR